VVLCINHSVLLSTGRARRVTPDRVVGRSIFWWLDRLGVLRASRETRIGRRMMSGVVDGKDSDRLALAYPHTFDVG